MTSYQSYAELARQHRQDEAYRISSRFTGSTIAVMAPHGGGIEPGTCALALAIAGTEHNSYIFQGLLPSGNRQLHLTSSLFDEPRALALANCCSVVVTVHGCRGHEPRIFVGGGNLQLADALRKELSAAGFTALPAVAAGLRGRHPGNLCNRGTSGQGVQLEFSRAMREQLLGHPHPEWRYRPLQLFRHLTDTVRKLLSTELGTTLQDASLPAADD